MKRVPLFWPWVESEAGLIEADGCSKVSGAFRKCCLRHDLEYFWGKDASDAYRLYIAGEPEYWFNAKAVTKGTADANFRRCMQSQSRFGFFSPVAFYRWLGVKLGATGAWESHREREQAGL